jgi:hypothetical protein
MLKTGFVRKRKNTLFQTFPGGKRGKIPGNGDSCRLQGSHATFDALQKTLFFEASAEAVGQVTQVSLRGNKRVARSSYPPRK